jgi:aspartate aminotransferase
MFTLSKRVQSIKPSATLAITKKVKELEAQGIKVLSFGAGEPDFDTPAAVKEAGIAAIKSGKSKYTAVDGIVELKDAIISKYKNEFGLIYNRNEVIVSTGCKQSLYNIFQAILDDGDEVIIPAPYWVSYPDMVGLAGGVSVIIAGKEENNFKIDPAQIAKAITPKTKAIILNSPSNPTGCVYSKGELEAIAKVLSGKNILIISDEVYEKLVYTGEKYYTIAQVSDEMKAKTIIINGWSKAYAMTGWRLGFAIGDATIIGALNKIQGQSTSNACSISQYAGLNAITHDQPEMPVMIAEFTKRAKRITKLLNDINGMSCNEPQGAFYVFPNISKLLGKKTPNGEVIKDSRDFASYLLDEAKVAVVPGVEFGMEGYMRLSFATSMEIIESGVGSISKAVAKLS